MFWYVLVPLVSLAMPFTSMLSARALFTGKVSRGLQCLLWAVFALSSLISCFVATLVICSVSTVGLSGDAGIGEAAMGVLLGAVSGMGLTALYVFLIIRRSAFAWILITASSCIALITITTFYYPRMLNTLRYEFKE